MMDLERAAATQLANIEKRSGKSLAELAAIIENSGLTKHGELVAMLKQRLGMGHGDANTLVHTVRRAATKASPETDENPLDRLYIGPKAELRTIHERLLQVISTFGEFEAAPKQSYVSYRRGKQFATIGPATRTQLELGLNAKGLEPTDRLQALPAGRMCSYRVRLASVQEVDAELMDWLRQAFESAA